jgi:hypothetical protein
MTITSDSSLPVYLWGRYLWPAVQGVGCLLGWVGCLLGVCALAGAGWAVGMQVARWVLEQQGVQWIVHLGG